jgi:hypothetical protein
LKYVIEIGSGAMICIPRFITIGPDIQKLMGGGIQRHRWDGDRISFYFFKNKEEQPSLFLKIFTRSNILQIEGSEFNILMLCTLFMQRGIFESLTIIQK